MTRIGVCGVGCEECPKRKDSKCPNGTEGCKPRENKFCKICTCAYQKNQTHCFSCAEFPCELNKEGPINYGFCQYLSQKS